MVKAKLIKDGKEINLLWFTLGFNRGADVNGRSITKSVFVGLKLIIETRKDLNLADWAIAPNETKQIGLHIYPVVMRSKTCKLYFYDCHLLNWRNDFSSTGEAPMSETLHISAAGVKNFNSTVEYSAYWRTNYGSRVTQNNQNKNNTKELKVKAQLS